MKTLHISDELYLAITKTLNDTRNAKNAMTCELESQEDNPAFIALDQSSAVIELFKASESAQANIELLNRILRAVKHTNTKPVKSHSMPYRPGAAVCAETGTTNEADAELTQRALNPIFDAIYMSNLASGNGNER